MHVGSPGAAVAELVHFVFDVESGHDKWSSSKEAPAWTCPYERIWHGVYLHNLYIEPRKLPLGQSPKLVMPTLTRCVLF